MMCHALAARFVSRNRDQAVSPKPSPAVMRALDTLRDALAGLDEAVGQPGFPVRVGSFTINKGDRGKA